MTMKTGRGRNLTPSNFSKEVRIWVYFDLDVTNYNHEASPSLVISNTSSN